MAILMVMELPGATAEQYDRVNWILGIRDEDTAPPGLVGHVCSPTDRGLLIVDVWETQEALDAFFVTGGLGAALAQAGIHEAQPRIYAVHNLLGGRAAAIEPV
jgi:hypothetical protein